jgi:hypothetical protein
MSAPELLARRSGWCHLCKLRIRKGEDYVSKIADRWWCHASCANEYRRTLAEQDEDAA